MNLFEVLPNLIERKITLSDLGISARVFSSWKDEGIIDYVSPLVIKEEINSKGEIKKRKWVYLNMFEAIWLLIVKDLRKFNLDLKTIIELKNFLNKSSVFTQENLEGISEEQLKNVVEQIVDEQFDGSFDMSLVTLENIKLLSESDDPIIKFYTSQIGTLIYYILISKQLPSILIYKNEEITSFGILNQKIFIHEMGLDNFFDFTMKAFSSDYFINVPVINVFNHLFEEENLEKYLNYYQLFSESEKEILHALRKDDFKEIIIYRESAEKYIITTTHSVELKNQQASELRKILGLKQYEKAEIIYRNDKHLVVHNTTKTTIEK